MSSDAPEAPESPATHQRVVLARRVEFSLIAIGGLFLILGWGIGHQEWARATGWVFTGIGFAIEMVYGRVAKAARSKGPDSAGSETADAGAAEADAGDAVATPRVSDESAS